MHSLRWLIVAPAIIFAFWPKNVQAEPQPGLAHTVYDNRTGQYNQYNASPPLPPTTPIIATGISPNIQYQWGGGPIMGTNVSEDVVVRWDGYLLPPDNQTYYLCAASDDGFRLILDDVTVINDWYDRGGGCGQTADVDFTDGEPKQLVAWWYENGGGAHATLLHYTGSGWAPIPPEWFWTEPPAPPTTTTEPATTTTEAVTTTTEPATTTEAATTTTEAITTTTEATTTTTSTTTTTTTTVYVPPLTTTSTTQPEPTTTTTTEPEPTTTLEPEPETTTTTEFVDPVPETILPPEPETPQSTTTEPAPTTTTLPEPSEPEQPVDEPSTTTVPVEPETVEELLADVTELAPAAIVQAVEQILTSQPTAEVATELATSPEVLAVVTEEQAEAIFETIAVEELTVTDAEAIVDAVQDAPKKVRKAFESAINVFGGLFDSYVMIGSTIPVDERRTLVAVSSTLVAVGTSLRRRDR